MTPPAARPDSFGLSIDLRKLCSGPAVEPLRISLTCPPWQRAGPVYDDLAVIRVRAKRSELCDPGGPASSLGQDPVVRRGVRERRPLERLPARGHDRSIQAPPAFDEGGNFIDRSFGPLSLTTVDASPCDGDPGALFGDYHIQAGFAGSGQHGRTVDLTGTATPELLVDFDGEPRPALNTGLVDIGADEVHAVTEITKER